MIPELGHFALIIALCVALTQGALPLIGAHLHRSRWIALARPAAMAQALLLAVAFACLTMAFVNNDFSVLYVAEHSNTLLPLPYRVAAVWGGHEGSLLLWVVMLGLWTLAVALFSKQLPEAMTARVLGVLGLVSAGFLLFILLTSNPFERLLPGAEEGRDLNPLLQDPGLIIHPPMLYMGYVGFSVAYAFAVSALLSGQLDAAWARWSRPWTTAAWVFLTLGIALGSGLGLLRTWLGRLVVLGPGGKRVLHALAGRYGAGALAGGNGETRQLQELDSAAGDFGLPPSPCWGPSLCAPAYSRRFMPLLPTRDAASSSSYFLLP